MKLDRRGFLFSLPAAVVAAKATGTPQTPVGDWVVDCIQPFDAGYEIYSGEVWWCGEPPKVWISRVFDPENLA